MEDTNKNRRNGKQKKSKRRTVCEKQGRSNFGSGRAKHMLKRFLLSALSIQTCFFYLVVQVPSRRFDAVIRCSPWNKRDVRREHARSLSEDDPLETSWRDRDEAITRKYEQHECWTADQEGTTDEPMIQETAVVKSWDNLMLWRSRSGGEHLISWKRSSWTQGPTQSLMHLGTAISS